jgi:tetratricopeptide (TPR) repeat protein
MSLLLDALKKAADDKQKVSQTGSPEPAAADDIPFDAGKATDLTDDSDKITSAAISETAVSEATEEFTLDAIESDITETSEDLAAAEERLSVSKENEYKDETSQKSSEQQDDDRKDSAASAYTVSDEALSMLIHKTNREVKLSKRLMLASVLLASLVVLVSGGVYYYLDMQAEIANLERKHQIAMQSMRSKTNSENTPEKSEIIRKLTSESDLDDKVSYAKQHMVKENSSQNLKPQSAVILKDKSKTGTASPAVSFQKTKTTDPVTEKLEAAWAAYEAAEYNRAKKLYKDVLNSEGNNRDALLGLGAIAVIEKNDVVARSVYSLLLKQDPRDPIAITALASLRNNKIATDADEKYLLNMLQKSPDDTHLNFALGNIYAQQNKWKLAQQSYFNAWQHDNENADYVFNLAVSMDQLGKQKQAIDLYRDCLRKAGNKQVSFARETVHKRITELSGL